MNGTSVNLDEIEKISMFSSVFLSGLSAIAFAVNTYLLNCSRYLRRPIGVNLRLCVTLTAADALCAFFYIITYMIFAVKIQFPNCSSLLLECFKLSTFFASVFTLLSLALNHYVGIVYPLRRHVITPRTVKSAIVASFLVPLLGIFILFSTIDSSFRSFAFYNDSCQYLTILRNQAVRWILVAPFILVVLLLSFLYGHIIVHMGRMSKDPLLTVNNIQNRSRRNSNRKLLITLVLLAGSACIGWLPTTVFYVLTCDTCLFPLPPYYMMWLQILAQALNVLKLIVDAFIYASRLIEIRYTMWAFNSTIKITLRRVMGRRANEMQQIPSEFSRYLSETKEVRATRKLNAHYVESDERGLKASVKTRTASMVMPPALKGKPQTSRSMRVLRNLSSEHSSA